MAQVHLAGDSSDQIEHEALPLEEDIPERRRLSLESNQMSRLVQGQTKRVRCVLQAKDLSVGNLHVRI